jgi:hypothetical protein
MLCEHGCAYASVVSCDDRSRGNGAVRGELQISTSYDRLGTRRNRVPRLAEERVDKKDTSSPKGGRSPVLYLLMGSKLVHLVRVATGVFLMSVTQGKPHVV